MRQDMDTTISNRLVTLGRIFFGVALVAWGIQHLVAGDFVTRVVPSWPAWIPERRMWADAAGALLIGAGVAIVVDRKARVAAMAFGALAFLSFLFLHVPLAANDMLFGGAWTSAGKALVMCGGAFAVAASLTGTSRHPSAIALSSAPVQAGIFIWARLCLGAFMILCGIQHFMFAGFVASLVPAWIPGAMFWTYFAGLALIAGGAGIIAPFVTWLAALLSGGMIFSWVFLVHLPLVVKNPHNAGDVAAVFEALAFSGVAWLLAGVVSRSRAAVRPGPRTPS